MDLRDLDWDAARVVPLEIRLGAGQADVFVPERVCVAGTAHVGVGESDVAGERNDGVDVDHEAAAGANGTPRLELDATVDAGQLRVINSDTASDDELRPRLLPRGRAAARGRAARLRIGMKADRLSLGSGAVIAALGGLVLLDDAGVIDVSLGWIAVALTAAVGVIVLLSGLADGGPSRHD